MSEEDINLFQACKSGELEKVKTLFEISSHNMHLTDEYGRTFLHWACRNGHVHVAEFLLSNGAYPYSKDNDGSIPLHLACRLGHVNVVNLLLSKVKPNRIKDYINYRDYGGSTPFHWACYNGNIHTLELLLHKGADVNRKDDLGSSPRDYTVNLTPDKKNAVVELIERYSSMPPPPGSSHEGGKKSSKRKTHKKKAHRRTKSKSLRRQR